jgi:hypothetical protein
MIVPVLLGSGRRFSQDTERKTSSRLVESRRFETGVVVQTYAQADAQPSVASTVRQRGGPNGGHLGAQTGNGSTPFSVKRGPWM